jgi:hypothetical protein
MAAPNSSVDIINLALGQLYQSPITSLNDANAPQATIANREYDACRRSLLASYNWTFAKTRAFCPQIANYIPPFDFSWGYQLPLDFLSFMWLGYDWHRYWKFPYDIQGNIILTGPPAQDPANTTATPWPHIALKYIQDNTNVASWRPTFIDCMKYKLASELCMPITGNMDMLKVMQEKLEMAIINAQKLNHIERPVLVTEVDPIEEARWVGNDMCQLNIDPNAWGNTDAR